MPRHRFEANVPLTLECPEAMRAAIAYVLAGEYEAGLDGSGLDILDVGANVGAFSVWASLRWPGSRIRAFEPNPGTFEMLARNVAAFPAITASRAALYPGIGERARLFSRYAGDGEAGLESYAGDTFVAGAEGGFLDVDVVDPASLPSFEIVKLDLEGGEAAVLASLDLARTVLVLAEFQNRRNREAMQATLAGQGFDAVLDEASPWDPILDYRDYRRELAGDVFGRMFYLRRGQTRLVSRA